jgi:hypothetical protein
MHFWSRALKRLGPRRVSREIQAIQPSTMKTDPSFKLVAAVILTGVFLALFDTAQAAEPKAKRTRTRTGTYQSSNGNSGTLNSTVTRGNGEALRTGTLTNQDGQTTTHTSDRKWDKTTGTGTVSSSTTLPDGDTMGRQGTLTKNADGSVSGQGTFTGYSGKTSTYAETTSKTATGTSTTGTITGPNGQASTVNSSFNRTAPGSTTRDTTVTGPNGKSTQKEIATKVNSDGTGTRVIETTKPDGTTETRTETFTITPAPKGP